MTALADANLVIAAINPEDALHARAAKHLTGNRGVVVPFSVGIELLMIARRHRSQYLELLEDAAERFEVERLDVLRTAAEALDTGEVRTVFDAVHLAEALHRSGSLHTADEDLQRTGFPTTAF